MSRTSTKSFRARRPDEKIFDARMISQTLVSGLAIGVLAFASWHWLVRVQVVEEASARNLVLLLMVLLQNVHVFICRSESVSAFKVPLRRNVILVFGVLAAQGIPVASMRLPFMQSILGTEPIPAGRWILCLILALSILAVMELFKVINRRRPSAA